MHPLLEWTPTVRKFGPFFEKLPTLPLNPSYIHTGQNDRTAVLKTQRSESVAIQFGDATPALSTKEDSSSRDKFHAKMQVEII